MMEGISAGLSAVFTLYNIGFLLVGCLTGTFIGMLPGLGPMTAIALMIPIASTLPAETAIMMMAAVYYGAIFGGSTSSILINAPGVASTVATSFDGYPMARAGQPGKALAIAALASFAGGLVAALLLLLFAPSLASVSLSFHSSDYFALMILGLVAVAAFGSGAQLRKALLMTLVGLMLSTVGSDPTQGVPRFTLGIIDLIDGVSFLLLVMATFALSEALLSILRATPSAWGSSTGGASARDSTAHTPSSPDHSVEKSLNLSLSARDIREASPAVARSSLLGFFVGLLPGAGATIASLLAYGSEHRLANPSRQRQFGQGSVRGLAAPEAANNAAATGSFVPLLTLGIPGSGTTAILLGAFIAYGVQPGPMLMISEPAMFWGVIVSMWLGNVVLLVLNLPLIPYIARILSLRQHFLLPLVLFFSLVGVYLVSFNTFDIQLMVMFAVVAVVFRLLDFPMAPMILGFILGGMIEENLHRALLIHDNSWTFLWQRPLTLAIMLLAMAVLALPACLAWLRRRSNRT